jgi:acetylornithine deacetylase/succinyl-diaminopimelate desuccinylase-like protein
MRGAETFHGLVQIDSPIRRGTKPVVDYLKQVLEAEGIPTQVFALEGANRPNLVARIEATGSSVRC